MKKKARVQTPQHLRHLIKYNDEEIIKTPDKVSKHKQEKLITNEDKNDKTQLDRIENATKVEEISDKTEAKENVDDTPKQEANEAKIRHANRKEKAISEKTVDDDSKYPV